MHLFITLLLIALGTHYILLNLTLAVGVIGHCQVLFFFLLTFNFDVFLTYQRVKAVDQPTSYILHTNSPVSNSAIFMLFLSII